MFRQRLHSACARAGTRHNCASAVLQARSSSSRARPPFPRLSATCRSCSRRASAILRAPRSWRRTLRSTASASSTRAATSSSTAQRKLSLLRRALSDSRTCYSPFICRGSVLPQSVLAQACARAAARNVFACSARCALRRKSVHCVRPAATRAGGRRRQPRVRLLLQTWHAGVHAFGRGQVHPGKDDAQLLQAARVSTKAARRAAQRHGTGHPVRPAPLQRQPRNDQTAFRTIQRPCPCASAQARPRAS